MSKVLEFPVPKTNVRTESAIQDLSMVEATADGTIVLCRQEAKRTCQTDAKDWDRDELAQLYNVESLLLQAGIRIASHRGVTDEGEPWIVYTRLDGQVFVHIARIDLTYLLDSPVLAKPVYSETFKGLIRKLERELRAASNNTAKLVMLGNDHRGEDIYLHPAVTLVAAVWSLYLLGNDIGTPVPLTEFSALSHLPQGTDLTPDDAIVAAQDVREYTTYSTERADLTRSKEDVQKTSIILDGRGATVPLKTTIAGILGTAYASTSFFHFEPASVYTDAQIFDHVQTTDSKRTQPTTGTTTSDNTTGTATSDNTTMVHEYKALATDGSQEVTSETAALAQVIDISEIPMQFTIQVQQPLPQHSWTGTIEVLPHEQGGRTEISISEEVRKDIAAEGQAIERTEIFQPTTGSSTAVVKALPPATSDDIVYEVWDTVLRQRDFEVKVLSSSAVVWDTEESVSDTDALGPVDLTDSGTTSFATPAKIDLSNAPTSSDITQQPVTDQVSVLGLMARAYTEHVRQFLFHLINDNDVEDIQLLKINGEIVVVDHSSLDDANDKTVMRSWLMEDGIMISTVGHFHDFAEGGVL